MAYDYGHPQYLAAREEALGRSGGVCQFCGQKPAAETHHWAERYPPEVETTAADLTALCNLCHEMATTMRRFVRAGGDYHSFMAELAATIDKEMQQWTTKSKSGASSPLSKTTARPDSTPGALPISKKAEITRKRGSNRTATDDARLRELDCQISLYLDESDAPTIPEAAIRACIETAARKMKQGPQVREGLIVTEVVSFDYDRERYGATVDELVKTAQFTVPVKMGQVRVNRTRAKFDEWSVTFRVDIDSELVDADQLELWLDIAGRRIGLGDWRPEKSGIYGRFETVSIEPIGN